jgi:hypothetical protein
VTGRFRCKFGVSRIVCERRAVTDPDDYAHVTPGCTAERWRNLAGGSARSAQPPVTETHRSSHPGWASGWCEDAAVILTGGIARYARSTPG